MLASGRAWAHGALHEQIAALTEKLAGQPNDAAMIVRRAELYRLHQDFPQALADYDRAAKLPQPPDMLGFLRGRALFEAAQLDTAQRELDAFLKAHPDHPDALLTRGRLLVRTKQPALAARDFDRAIAQFTTPEPDYYLEHARALAATGKLGIDPALRALEGGMKKLGSVVSLELPALEYEIELRRWDAALARVERNMAPAPRKETWHKRRGEILLRAGRAKDARDAFEAGLAAIATLPETVRHVPATLTLEKELQGLLKGGKTPRAPAMARKK